MYVCVYVCLFVSALVWDETNYTWQNAKLRLPLRLMWLMLLLLLRGLAAASASAALASVLASASPALSAWQLKEKRKQEREKKWEREKVKRGTVELSQPYNTHDQMEVTWQLPVVAKQQQQQLVYRVAQLAWTMTMLRAATTNTHLYKNCTSVLVSWCWWWQRRQTHKRRALALGEKSLKN